MLDRLVILHSRMSGYMAACHRALKNRYGTELLCVHSPVAGNAPFDESIFGHFDHRYSKGELSVDHLEHVIRDFDPQAILMSGWSDRDYLRVSRRLRRSGVPVIAGSDAQWTGSFRQKVGVLAAPVVLHRAIDVLWVAGERQRQFARRLGFTGPRCLSGVYACDWPRFDRVYQARGTSMLRESFLYVGRFIERKGLDVLLQAYEMYCRCSDHPWRLVCAGSGELAGELDGLPGVENVGFIQPEELPELMSEAGAFVLPSRKEPWGVVVQEAAAAGLPLICSDASGAAVHFLQDGYNGFLVESGNARHLANGMDALGRLDNDERNEMSRRSHELSKQFMPERWATTLVRAIRDVSTG